VVVSLARWCSSEEEVVVGVEQWAEIRRLYFVKRLAIKGIVRRTGHGRNTIRRALRSAEAPRYRRLPRPSKLDPFREEVHRLLRQEPRLPGKRVHELLEEQGFVGGKTILDDYLREVRPLFLPRPRTFQRTSYRPGALCQFDLWQPSRESRSVPARPGAATSWLAACPTRARAPARWCSRRRRPTCSTGSAAASPGWERPIP